MRCATRALTALSALVVLSGIPAAPRATADDHEVPATKLRIGGKARGGKIIAAGFFEPTEHEGSPTCSPTTIVFSGRWPKPLKVPAKRYRAKIVLSTSRMPESVQVERRVYTYPPPMPGAAIEGKPIPHKLVPVDVGGVTVRYLVRFRVRVPRKTLYVQLAVVWPDEDHCEGDFARYGWVLRAKGA